MTTRGRLDEISLPDLLQTLSSGRHSGKLTLSHRNGYGVVLVRDGRVIYAASNRTREALGSILASRELVTEETLRVALAAQNESPRECRLGSILLEMGAVSEHDLRESMRYQVAEVLRDFLSWKEGYFKFQPGTIPDRGEIGVDCQDLVLDEGLTAEGVLVDVVRRHSDAESDGSEELVGGASSGGDGSGEPLSLVDAMAEVRSPAFTGEISLRILRYAAEVLGRGVLFAIGRDLARSVGQFGIDPEETEAARDRVRGLKLPLDQDSIVARAAASQETERGRPVRTTWNEHLADALGGVIPPEAVAIPLTVNGATAFVLYGDNLPNPGPVGSVELLEGLIIEAGLAIEREALAKRVQQLEQHPPE